MCRKINRAESEVKILRCACRHENTDRWCGRICVSGLDTPQTIYDLTNNRKMFNIFSHLSALLCRAFSFLSPCFFESVISSSGSRRSCRREVKCLMEYKRNVFPEQTATITAGYLYCVVSRTLSVVNWYCTCPWKASWIPDMAWAVFSQKCSSVVCHDREEVEGMTQVKCFI